MENHSPKTLQVASTPSQNMVLSLPTMPQMRKEIQIDKIANPNRKWIVE